MRRVFLIPCFVLLFTLPLTAAKRPLNAYAVVDFIIDGDTFGATVLMGNDMEIPVRVRFMDIDAPELNGECESEIIAAHAAKDRLAELIPVGSRVMLTQIKDDKFLGRINAFVVDSMGRNISEIMISEGHARKYGGGRREGWCD